MQNATRTAGLSHLRFEYFLVPRAPMQASYTSTLLHSKRREILADQVTIVGVSRHCLHSFEPDRFALV